MTNTNTTDTEGAPMTNLTPEARREREAVVAWLRAEAKLCDCAAFNEGECCCGAWDENKSMNVNELAERLESGQHRGE